MLSTRKDINITIDDMDSIVNDIDKKNILDRLYELTNPEPQGSGFRDELRICEWHPGKYRGRKIVFLAWLNEKIVGWCMIHNKSILAKTYDFGIFCDPQYRRCGIAASLLKEATKYAGEFKIQCYPWDPTGRNFFRNFDEQLKIEIIY